jgi:hypothetical protein
MMNYDLRIYANGEWRRTTQFSGTVAAAVGAAEDLWLDGEVRGYSVERVEVYTQGRCARLVYSTAQAEGGSGYERNASTCVGGEGA